jgi:transposase
MRARFAGMVASERYVPKLSLEEKERRRRLAGVEIVQALASGELPRGFQSRLAEKYGVTRAAACKWVNAVREEGIEALRARAQGGSDPWLDAGQREELRDLLLLGARSFGFDTDVWTGRRVAFVIEETFGVKYDPRYVPELLRKRLGFSWQKPKRSPREMDPVRVHTWLREVWEPAKKGRSKAA